MIKVPLTQVKNKLGQILDMVDVEGEITLTSYGRDKYILKRLKEVSPAPVKEPAPKMLKGVKVDTKPHSVAGLGILKQITWWHQDNERELAWAKNLT